MIFFNDSVTSLNSLNSLNSLISLYSSSDDEYIQDANNQTSFLETNSTFLTSTKPPRVASAPEDQAIRDLIARMQWVLLLLIIPSISIIGFFGNIMSIILISRDGFRKSSNVLLIAIALADTSVLVGSVYRIFFERIMDPFLLYSDVVNKILYYIYTVLIQVVANIGLVSSYTFAMLVTAERLCAIFFPLQFHLIITPLRTTIVLIVIVLFYLAYAIATALTTKLFSFMYGGRQLTIIRRSAFYKNNKDVIEIIQDIVNELTGTACIAFLILGSLVISYKIKMAAKRRAKMMSEGSVDKGKKNAAQSRTTKTLLTVCVTFVILSGLIYIYQWVLKSVVMEVYVHIFFDRIQLLLTTINSSCNFFIYIFNNSKFKDQLVAMFRCNRNKSKAVKRRPTFQNESSKLP